MFTTILVLFNSLDVHCCISCSWVQQLITAEHLINVYYHISTVSLIFTIYWMFTDVSFRWAVSFYSWAMEWRFNQCLLPYQYCCAFENDYKSAKRTKFLLSVIYGSYIAVKPFRIIGKNSLWRSSSNLLKYSLF